MKLDSFLTLVKKIEGLEVIDLNKESNFLVVSIFLEETKKELDNIINELKSNFACEISLNFLEDKKYKLHLGSIDLDSNLKAFVDKLAIFIERQEANKKGKFKELGIPDLTLVTIKQMVEELKRRKNLVFSMVWIENNERDNISIEGSGNPTQLVGLLTRGVHMAIEWADRSIRFNK